MLILLKIFAWIWGIAIVIVLVIDIVNLCTILNRGYKVKVRRYLFDTLKACCMAPLVYPYIIRGMASAIRMIVDWYRNYSSDSE